MQTPNPKHQKGSHLNWVGLDCQVITLDSHSVVFVFSNSNFLPKEISIRCKPDDAKPLVLSVDTFTKRFYEQGLHRSGTLTYTIPLARMIKFLLILRRLRKIAFFLRAELLVLISTSKATHLHCAHLL